VKANALSKSRISRPSSTLILKGIQMFEHKWKKEKTPPLEIYNKVLKKFMVVCKKRLTIHGDQKELLEYYKLSLGRLLNTPSCILLCTN
jgi:hypothetical protein